ncbi:MAG: MBL fold metallo-hydrolase [Pseudomonadota bacterium]
MTRTPMACILTALIAMAPLSAVRAQNFNSVQMRVLPVQGAVSMITGRGGNIGLFVGDEAVLLVDDQFAPLSAKLLAAVAEVTDQPIDFVINTHWHADHTDGNENLGKMGALIVAHDNVRRRLVLRHFAEQAEGFVSAPALPVVTFSEAVTFHLNGEEVRVFKVAPGHTDGDAIVHFTGSDVIHMGDIFFNGLYSFFDRSSGGRLDGMIAALQQGLALAGLETKFIPGHGPLADRDDIEAHTARMVEIRRRVAEAIEQGVSKADFIAAKPTADLAEAFTGAYQVMPADRFLALVYDDLSR